MAGALRNGMPKMRNFAVRSTIFIPSFRAMGIAESSVN
jgi:hypothetical protein